MNLEHSVFEQRLEALEIKISFTEELVEQLDRVVVRQQLEIGKLILEIKKLRDRSSESEPHLHHLPQHELPPHY